VNNFIYFRVYEFIFNMYNLADPTPQVIQIQPKSITHPIDFVELELDDLTGNSD